MQWYILVGVLLMFVSALEPLLKNRWLAGVHLQLLGGLVAGPWFLDLVNIDLIANADILEIASEIAVIISLYATGIKMRIPLQSGRWKAPVILATLTMVFTIALTTLLASQLLSLPLPLALLLGAVLAPTDPVLADKIQIHHPSDDDRLRQSLTGEAGLNDGTAFPFVLLAIGLANPAAHELGEGLWRWVLIDLLWKVCGGVMLGAIGGHLLGRCILWFRKLADGQGSSGELLTIGLIAIIYGIALALDTYAFLAVFAAAISLRRIEMSATDESAPQDSSNQADDDTPVALVREQTEVGSALEQIVKVFLVFVVGAMIYNTDFTNWRIWLFAVGMLFLVRPVCVFATLRAKSVTPLQRGLIAWFGIRGIGTLYYRSHAIKLGIADESSADLVLLADCCVVTILLSIFLHGTTDTPLMQLYHRQQHRQELAG
ncbi:MAG: cation:proton antiporter [Pirellulaceae bacterium]|nr:cation:proton antiporter [Pirellulaceae bacterium]